MVCRSIATALLQLLDLFTYCVSRFKLGWSPKGHQRWLLSWSLSRVVMFVDSHFANFANLGIYIYIYIILYYIILYYIILCYIIDIIYYIRYIHYIYIIINNDWTTLNYNLTNLERMWAPDHAALQLTARKDYTKCRCSKCSYPQRSDPKKCCEGATAKTIFFSGSMNWFLWTKFRNPVFPTCFSPNP